MLSDKEITALTLRAPFVHDHGDRPYFMHELNSLAAQLEEPKHLNFFVRYRSEPGDATKHKWSRIERVVFIEEVTAAGRSARSTANGGSSAAIDTATAAASGRPGLAVDTDIALNCDGIRSKRNVRGGPAMINSTHSNGAHASNTVMWRNKVFWIALMVVGEEGPVYLPRLSASLPSEDEIQQYCALQCLLRPDETYSAIGTVAGDHGKGQGVSSGGSGLLDGSDMISVRGDCGSDVVPGEHTFKEREAKDSSDVDIHGVLAEVSSRPPRDSMAVARTYLPTAAQILKLSNFREVHLVRHTWTTEETEEAARLHTRYAVPSAGAAIAPMAATINRVRNWQLETKLMQSSCLTSIGNGIPGATTGSGVGAVGGGSTPAGSAPFPTHTQSPGSPSSPLNSQQQHLDTKRNLRGQAVYTGRSPFLPRRLRERPVDGDAAVAVAATTAMAASQDASPFASAFDNATPESQLTPPPPSSPSHLSAGNHFFSGSQAVIDPFTVEQWRSEYDAQLNFYTYVTDEQRSGYINKIAHITTRNALENRRNRLVGIEMEKQRSRQANFVESGGLWVTDDRGRAEKAAQYKAAVEREPAAGEGRKEKKVTLSAEEVARQAAEEAARQTREKAERQERLLNELRRAHLARATIFAAVPDEWMTGEFPAMDDAAACEHRSGPAVPVGPMSANRLQLATSAGAKRGRGNGGTDASAGASSTVEKVRIASQLLHRSTATMAGFGDAAVKTAHASTAGTGASATMTTVEKVARRE